MDTSTIKPADLKSHDGQGNILVSVPISLDTFIAARDLAQSDLKDTKEQCDARVAKAQAKVDATQALVDAAQNL